MLVASEDKNRKIIPRWRPFATTLGAGELSPSPSHLKKPVAPVGALDETLRAFKDTPTLVVAADLTSAAVAAGQPERAQDAARMVLDNHDCVTSAATVVARRVLGIAPPAQEALAIQQVMPVAQARQEVHALRSNLHTEPRNTFLWVDLARLYTSLGHGEQAERAMRAALSLSPCDRFVLRSACRFFVHLDRYRDAHDILARNPRVPHDSWLLSAEIAAASVAHRTSRLVRRGKGILDQATFAPFHTSELSSAIATLNFEAGSDKHGRKFLRDSLIMPTENAVAQAAWVARNFYGGGVTLPAAATSFEARAWSAYYSASWARAVQESAVWLGNEPFSARPAVFGSYIAATTLEDYENSAVLARQGLLANSDDITLRNNLAFALANMGKVDDAKRVFDRLTSVPRDIEVGARISLIATLGLLEFRSNNPQGGSELYRHAVEMAQASGDKKRMAVATVYWALEEIRAKSSGADALRDRALALSTELTGPELAPLLNRLRRTASEAAGRP